MSVYVFSVRKQPILKYYCQSRKIEFPILKGYENKFEEGRVQFMRYNFQYMKKKLFFQR